MKRAVLLAGLIALLAAARAETCSICEGQGFTSPTFRQEAALPMARVILHGTIDNPRASGVTGQTDFHVKTVLRDDMAIKGLTKIVLPRYLPADKKDPPHYILFADVDGKKIDAYRGVPIKGKQASVDYLKKALALKAADTVANLQFYFKYLEDADAEVARDAFLEFAKASDADVAKVAPKLDAAKLRGWLKSDKVPAYRLGVYALLLGACGKEADAAYLKGLLGSKEERYASVSDGA